MWFGALGPLCVTHSSSVIPVPAARQRVLLAAMLVQPGRVVSFDELGEVVWDGTPPPGARATLRNYIKRLRQVLGPDAGRRIVTRDPGYLIDAGEDEVDLVRFAALCAEGGRLVRSSSWRAASDELIRATALWRGAALADIRSEVLKAREVPRLEQMRLQAMEWRIEADLQLGGHHELIPELRALVSEHPWREHFHAQLMLALYRSGRQGEALAAYRAAWHALIGDLGVEPGPDLQRLHQRMLAADPGLAGPATPTARTVAAGTVAAGTVAAGTTANGTTAAVACASSAEQTALGPAGSWAGRPSPGMVIPRQLPGDVRHFTGRRDHLSDLDQAGWSAAEYAMVVQIAAADGGAGVGASALAVHWAHQAAAWFPDGQLYVNLRGASSPPRPVDAEAALAGFLDALAVPPAQVPEGLPARAALFRRLLTGRRMLIILDDARAAAQVRPLLPGTPGTLVVITSRRPVCEPAALDGSIGLTVGVLSLADSRELLARRMGARRVAAEPSAAAELVSLCRGLPLALNIVAARCAADPGLLLEDAAGALRAAVAAERTRTERTLAERTVAAERAGIERDDSAVSVRAALAWSGRRLSPSAARMLRLLAVHPGPRISLPAAASLAALTEARTQATVTELIAAHLLTEPAPGRYSLHELPRAWAAEQASVVEEPARLRAAVRRMLDHYLHTAHSGALALNSAHDPVTLARPAQGTRPERLTGQASALAWFAAEREVLLAAVEQAATEGYDSHAWQLPWALADYLEQRGCWRDWTQTQQTALAAVRRIADVNRPGPSCRPAGRTRVLADA
jgi:DNA-binding SARP family transcriptional activator